MKYVFLCFLFIGFCNSIEASLTLKQCQEKALIYNDQLIFSGLAIDIEETRLAEVQALRYPSLTADGQYIATGERLKSLRHNKRANAKASLSVPLFNFGGMSNLITAQKRSVEASIYQSQKTKLQVLLEVSEAYFAVLGAKNMQTVLEESLKALREQGNLIRDLCLHEAVHENESLLVEVQINQREQELIDAEQLVALSLLRLNRLLGEELSCPTDIEDQLEECVWERDFDCDLEKLKQNHPQLLAIEKQLEATQLAIKGEKGALYPMIYGFTDFSTTKDYNFPFTHGITIGVGVKWNLYDGGATKAKVTRRRKEAMILTQQYKSVSNDLELALRAAYLKVRAAKNKIPVAQKNINFASKNLRISQEKFQEGYLNLYALLLDEARLAEAKSNYYQSLYDFHKARCQLIYTAGVVEECLNENSF